jgi:hypothetical protein
MRVVALSTAACLALSLAGLSTTASAAPAGTVESAVTDDGAYVRHDGGTDQAIQHCSTGGSSATPVDPAGGDADPNDGGNRRQGNEPSVAVDPTNPNLVVAGWNDYCQSDLAAGWQGLAYSTDRGASWTDSVVPGYPADTSSEGMASPLYGTHTDAGDPLVAFDNDGRLFVGGIAFNRVKPSNGDVWLASYSNQPHSSGYPKDYLRTVIVGMGTPSEVIAGIFQDKPSLEVDRTGGPDDGNVYMCWSRFVGASGRTKIFFSRSTDHGASFSRPMPLSEGRSVQGCDIAVEHDGDVYVTWGTFNTPAGTDQDGMAFARSTNGGASFSRAGVLAGFTRYFPFDGSRDCGDATEFCGPPGYVFHRVPLEPRVTADQTGQLPGIYATFNAIDPTTRVASTSPYSSADPGFVGRSVVYVARSTTNGQTWDDPVKVDNAGGRGHQYFSDVDAYAGRLMAVWQDNRTDDDYSVQLPIGNTLDAQGRAISSAEPLQAALADVVGTYASVSTNGTSFTPLGMISTVTHQPQKEMFANRSVPFQGDYNWVALADSTAGPAIGSLFAYAAWTDNRQVVGGADPRELEADGYDDGFDVLQCRTDLGAGPPLPETVPLARRDAPYSGDNCGNAGGLDQDIFGAMVPVS